LPPAPTRNNRSIAQGEGDLIPNENIQSKGAPWPRRARVLAVVVVLLGVTFAYGAARRAHTWAPPSAAGSTRAADRAFANQLARQDAASAGVVYRAGRAADRSFANQYARTATNRAADRAFAIEYAAE
jgi:hypothetical protein